MVRKWDDPRCKCKRCKPKHRLAAQCDMESCDCCFVECRRIAARSVFGNKRF